MMGESFIIHVLNTPEWIEVGVSTTTPLLMNTRKITFVQMNPLNKWYWYLDLVYSEQSIHPKEWVDIHTQPYIRFVYTTHGECKSDFTTCLDILKNNITRHSILYSLNENEMIKGILSQRL